MTYQLLSETAPITKTEQAETADQIVSTILDGSIDPLKAFIELKAFANVVATAIKDPRVQDAVLDEISKYEVEKRAFGVTVGKGSTGNKYDFSNSSEYVMISTELEDKKKELKEISAALIAAYHSPLRIASMDDGTELSIKMIEPGRETIKITFGK